MSLVFLLSIIPYMLPTIIAAYRDLADKTAICLLNLLLGWTVIGWVLVLIWACLGERDVQPVEAAGDLRHPAGLKLQGRDPRGDHL